MKKRAFVLLPVAGLFGAIMIWFFSSSSRPERLSGAYEALSFFSAARSYPLPVIPDRAAFVAFEYAQIRLKKSDSPASEVPPWRLIGPENIGGRTLALAINPKNPSTIYAGSASGGLWRSFTGGVGTHAWQYVDTGMPVLGVSTIAIDPSDTNVIYIGTGEVYAYQNANGGRADRTTRGSYGIGILKTTDGGKTWKKSLDWSMYQRRGVQKLVIHPAKPHILYAATTEGTYKSTDGGASWRRIHDVIMAMDVDLNPRHPDTVFVSCGNFGSEGHGIYRSLNGGESWEKLTRGLPSEFTGKPVLSISAQNPRVMYADITDSFASIGIYRSDDGGDTWTRVISKDIAWLQGWYSHYVAVSPHDSNLVLAGGIDLWRIIPGNYPGYFLAEKVSDWTGFQFGRIPQGGPEGPPDYLHSDHHDIAFHPTDPNIIYFATDGGVFRSTDGARTFEGLNGGYATTQFYNGFSSSPVDSFLALGGMQDNSTAIYTGEPAWIRVIGGDGAWTAVHPQNPLILYGSFQFLTIYKSDDGGNRWFPAVNGITHKDREFTSFISPFVLSPSHPDILYAGTRRVYKSTDGARSWEPVSVYLDGNPILSMAVSFNSPDTVYVATAPTWDRAGVFRTFDGGRTWQTITGSLPDRYPMDLCVDPNNALRVYVVLGGFGTPHVFASDDGGDTWKALGAELPDVPTSAIVVDPEAPEHLYVGTDIGVFISTNGGDSWEEWNQGMPPAIITDLSISPQNRKIRAATHGNAVWERPLIEKQMEAPSRPIRAFDLLPPYPNPVSKSGGPGTGPGSVRIRFELPETADIELTLYNALGQTVLTVFSGEKPAGAWEIPLNTAALSPGLYFLRFRTGALHTTQKLVILP